MGVPFVLVNPREVNVIHSGKLTLCQRYLSRFTIQNLALLRVVFTSPPPAPRYRRKVSNLGSRLSPMSGLYMIITPLPY
jgi:hypothetical protein